MRTALKKAVIACLLCMTAHSGIAQAYPDSSASWCSLDFNGSTLTQIHVIMEADPDTAILGQNYKRIEAYNTDGWFGDPVLVQR